MNDEMSSENINQEEIEDLFPKTVAFILCHPINTSLQPISNELPSCLFPLCNIPILFYNLQWLNNNGIKKIYIVCQKSDKNPIQKFVDEYSQRFNNKSIEILYPENNCSFNSISDSIKWIYSSSSVSSEFKNSIILPGTTVTNIPLKKILKEIRGNQIITTIFTKSKSNGYKAIVDNEGYLLQLDIPPTFNFEINQEENINEKSDNSNVQTNLNNSSIYIVTPEFMSIFSSNNYIGCNSIMDDCVPSLIDHEKDKKSVRAFILPSNFYSSDINDIQNYINSSIAIIDKHLLPFIIESNPMSPSQTYTHLYDDDENNEEEEAIEDQNKINDTTKYHTEKDSVYIDKDVVIKSSTKIDHSIIGYGTSIENDCLIQNSTIGNSCTFGKGVTVTNCIIWDRVTIEDGAHINNSVIASDCSIKNGVNIDFGSLISFNVVVDIDLQPCRRLVGYENNEEEVEFKEDNSPDWLKNYINNREPLKMSDEINYYEFKPQPEAEIHLLNLWYQLSPKTFPIDISKIRNEETNDDKENEEEEEESFQYDEMQWEKNKQTN